MVVLDNHVAGCEQYQYQLLLNPFQPALWAKLVEALRPPAAVVEPTVARASASNPPADPKPEPSILAPQPGVPAAAHLWSRRFHPVGSAEADAVLEQQLQDFQTLVEGGQLDVLLRRLDHATAPLLAECLSPEQSFALGQRAYDQQLYPLAAPLLARAASVSDPSLDLLPWALLFRGLTQRGLGTIHAARQMLEALLIEVRQPDRTLAWADVGVHAQVALAWMNLNSGATAEADALLQQLHSTPQAATMASELDLLGRVISTLHWLGTHPRDALSPTEDRVSSCRLMVALDTIRLSPCGGLLQIRGWLVDPEHQLRELCLVRGQRVWRLDLGQARYSHRPDLAELIRRCGGTSDLDAGLELIQISLGDERFSYQPGEAAELFVLLANGEQFCLRRPIEIMDLQSDQIRSLLDTTIQEPCRLVSAGLLYRVRSLWSEWLVSRLERPAEHHHFGHRPHAPEVSVLVPLYGRLDFMEYQLNWFHAWRRRRGSLARNIQLIYVLDDPDLKTDCLSLAKRCNILYDMPFELVVNSKNLGFAGANNSGAAYAKAPLLLLLNSDVLPANDRSLDVLLRAMHHGDGRIGAIGARLLFDNGAIQHQGMEFVQESNLEGELGRVWLNDHPLKGLKIPAAQDSASGLEEVEAATAACLLLSRQLFSELAGLSTHYLVGDFEDSDLCLKLRQRGLAVLVDQTACFYHLERQSVELSDTKVEMRMKLVAANAITHHQHWCSSIERLQSSEVNA